jgi:hypothetical protein
VNVEVGSRVGPHLTGRAQIRRLEHNENADLTRSLYLTTKKDALAVSRGIFRDCFG